MEGINCIFTIALLMLTHTLYSEAICCGKGSKGYCKDCTKISTFGRTKCCGAGSGHGKGCNIFCCNCGGPGGKCRTGKSTITYQSGWWLGAKYTCTLIKEDAEVTDARSDISETRKYFDSLDTDNDNILSFDEFAEALRQHMNLDFESSYSLASDLLNDENQEDVISLMDVAQNVKNLDEDSHADDVINMVRREFLKMDTNEDGVIQAKEFDSDL